MNTGAARNGEDRGLVGAAPSPLANRVHASLVGTGGLPRQVLAVLVWVLIVSLAAPAMLALALLPLWIIARFGESFVVATAPEDDTRASLLAAFGICLGYAVVVVLVMVRYWQRNRSQ